MNLLFEQFYKATAFLNGDVEEELDIPAPEGLQIPPGNTLRLLKSLYDLKQAPRCFNKKFKQVLDQLGMRQIFSDPCGLTGCGDDLIILSLYVDDGIIFAESKSTIKKLLDGLKKNFSVNSNYFLGLEIAQDKGRSTIFLHHQAYARRVIEKFGFIESRKVATPLET